MQELSIIQNSDDNKWKFLMNTVQDKGHFHIAALSKIESDAMVEQKYHFSRQSPSFKKPPDKVNDTSLFPIKQLDSFDKMKL